MQKIALLLATLGLGAIAGWLVRRRTPAEIRRLEYHMTFPEELIAVISDPVQLGMTLGVAAGVAGVVAAQAGRRHAAQHPLPQRGLALPGADPDAQAQIVQMAEQAAEVALVGPKI